MKNLENCEVNLVSGGKKLTKVTLVEYEDEDEDTSIVTKIAGVAAVVTITVLVGVGVVSAVYMLHRYCTTPANGRHISGGNKLGGSGSRTSSLLARFPQSRKWNQ